MNFPTYQPTRRSQPLSAPCRASATESPPCAQQYTASKNQQDTFASITNDAFMHAFSCSFISFLYLELYRCGNEFQPHVNQAQTAVMCGRSSHCLNAFLLRHKQHYLGLDLCACPCSSTYMQLHSMKAKAMGLVWEGGDR